jgi:SlyX protein
MSDDEKDLAARLEVLEIRAAYQDETVETLNETITAQWKEIDHLKRQIARLTERLEDAENKGGAPVNERPPHY